MNCTVLHHVCHHRLGLLSLVVGHFKFSRDTLDIGTRLFSSVSLSRAGGSKTSHIYQKKCFPVIFITNKLPAFSSNSRACIRPSWIQSCSAGSPRPGTWVSAGGDLGGTLSPGLSGSNAAGPLRPHLTEFDLWPRALTVTSALEFDLEFDLAFDLNKLRAYSRPSWIQSCSAESPRRGTLVSAGETWAGRSLRAAPGRMLSGHSDRT